MVLPKKISGNDKSATTQAQWKIREKADFWKMNMRRVKFHVGLRPELSPTFLRK